MATKNLETTRTVLNLKRDDERKYLFYLCSKKYVKTLAEYIKWHTRINFYFQLILASNLLSF
jgi:hypothetical protein